MSITEEVKATAYGNPSRLERTISARRLPAWRRERVVTMQPFVDMAQRLPDDQMDSNLSDGALHADALKRATLFYGTPEFSRLLAGAHRGFDLEGSWTSVGPPLAALDGMVYLTEPLRLEDPDRGEHLDGRYLLWTCVPDHDSECAYVLFWLAGLVQDQYDGSARTGLTIRWEPKPGERAAEFQGYTGHDAARVVMAAWHLMAQDGLTETHQERVGPPPGTRRARKRARQGKEPEVTVVNLRAASRKRQAVAREAGESPYHHRWVVRGHWREQACGPRRSQRRRIYIEPHYKGPDGAPLLHAERVFQW